MPKEWKMIMYARSFNKFLRNVWKENSIVRVMNQKSLARTLPLVERKSDFLFINTFYSCQFQ